MQKHNNEEEKNQMFHDAINTVWQMDKEMELVLEGLRNERECLYADIRQAKQKGLGTDWILGEMMGIDKAIALLTPLPETESQ
jgi:hypothetical protein